MTLAPVQHIGWLLVHSVWQFTLIAVVLAVVLRLMRGASPGARYVAALAGWGLMLLAPVVTWFALPATVITESAAPMTAYAVGELSRSLVASPPSHEIGLTSVRDSDAIPPSDAALSTLDAQRSAPRPLTSEFRPLDSLRARIAPWLNTLVVLWCVGVCLFAVRSARSWYVVRGLLHRDVVAAPDEMTSLLVRVLKRIGLKHRVRLLQSPHVNVPLVVGWLRPVILLPVCVATGFSPQQLEAVLAHELAHIRRHDYLINLLQTLSETVFFYHPALWWASAVVRREREHCCDELAAQALGNRAEYGRALLALEELRGETPSMALGAKGGSLLERIRRLAQLEPTPRLGAGGVIGIAVVAALIVTAAVWGANASQEVEKADATSVEVATTSDPDEAPVTDDATPTPAAKPARTPSLTDADATSLAHRAHALAAAIDKLPRFSLRAHGQTKFEYVVKAPSQDPLDDYLAALDPDVPPGDWYRYEEAFAWDEERVVIGMLRNQNDRLNARNTWSADGVPPLRFAHWGSPELGGERSGGGEHPVQHVLQRDLTTMWLSQGLVSPNYLMVTHHQFWFGDNGRHGQNLLSGAIPPDRVAYRSLGTAEFDGETCEVVESPVRGERLWIGQRTGFIRCWGQYCFFPQRFSEDHPEFGKDFKDSEIVRRIAGKKFASSGEYGSWYLSTLPGLPLETRIELATYWGERSAEYFDEYAEPTLLVRFRDFREIAPGVWWPFREDRANNLRKREDGQIRGAVTNYTVHEILTDFDLTEAVNGLQPREGERVQDQRYIVPVDYEYRADRPEAETLKLVDAEYQERLEGQAILDQLSEPLKKLVGQPAPSLPDTGWVGGQKPDVAGKPYLLHFWATWCGPCKNDLPLLKQIAANGAIVIGMHPTGTPLEEVQKAVDENQLGYPTFVETSEQASGPGRTIAGYPADIFPHCILVDAQGKVAAYGSLMANNGEIGAKFRELREAAESAAVAPANDTSSSDSAQRAGQPAAAERTDLTIIQAQHALLLDGNQIVTWPDIDAKIAALPDPSRVHPQLYVTRGAMDAKLWDAAWGEVGKLSRKYKMGGQSVGSLMPRTDFHYDRIKTPADLVPDPSLRREGTVVDKDGKPVAGAEVVLITPVDESLSYKAYDIAIVSGRVRNPFDEILTRTDDAGRFSVYPPANVPFSLLALHPENGISLVEAEQFTTDPRLRLLQWGGIVAEFSKEPEEQSAVLRTRLEASDTRPEITLTQYWVDLHRPEPTLKFEFTYVPPIWSTAIQRSFSQLDGGSTSIHGASLSVFPGETQSIKLGPVSKQQREFLKEIHERVGPQAQAAPAEESATAEQSDSESGVDVLCVDADGKPVAGAEVYVFQYAEGDPGKYAQSGPHTTDADGRTAGVKRVVRDEAGHFDRFFYARVPGKLVGVGRSVHWKGHDVINADGRIEMRPSRTVDGKVTVPAGSDPTKVTLRVQTMHILTGDGVFDHQSWPREDHFAGLNTALSEIFERHPSADGTFQFADVPVKGRLYVLTHGGGFGEAQWANYQTNNFDKPIDLLLVPEGVLTGRVVARGQPVEGIEVAARRADRASYASTSRTRTDSQGQYTLRGLAATQFNVSVNDPQGRWVFRPQQGVSTLSGKTTNLDLELVAPVTVSGRVVDAAGSPIAGAAISALTDNSHDVGLDDDVTGHDGRYELRLPPGGAQFYFNGLPDGFAYPDPQIILKLDIKPDQTGIDNGDYLLRRKGEAAPASASVSPSDSSATSGQSESETEPALDPDSVSKLLQEIRAKSAPLLAALASEHGYGLTDGEDIKRVPLPFDPLRMEYYRVGHPGQSDAISRGPTSITFRWDGNVLGRPTMTFSGEDDAGVALVSLCDNLLNLKPQEIEGRSELLQLAVSGDWVVRTGANRESLIEQLNAILAREAPIPVRLALRSVKRPVYVALGEYNLTPLPGLPAEDRTQLADGVRVSDALHIFGQDAALKSSSGGGGCGDFDEFLSWLGRWIEAPIVSQVQTGPSRGLCWSMHRSDPSTEESRKLDQDPERVLANITRQTGLTFVKAERDVRILFVELAERE